MGAWPAVRIQDTEGKASETLRKTWGPVNSVGFCRRSAWETRMWGLEGLRAWIIFTAFLEAENVSTENSRAGGDSTGTGDGFMLGLVDCLSLCDLWHGLWSTEHCQNLILSTEPEIVPEHHWV